MPQTLDDLGEAILLWEKLHDEQESMQAKIPPLFDQFGILEKYEVHIPEDIQELLNELHNEWSFFQQALIDADTALKKHKVRK